ncbi:TonB-dependent receptor [Balneolales bacterium ANBcel1]|nr:TonB-dependent receptor [Balneolales bacterium ANBcel1]
MRTTALLIALLLLPSLAFSSALKVVSLNGRVLDGETGEPVAYVYLHLEEINRVATSGRDGRFQLNNIPEGSYTLALHRIGYYDQKRSITVDPDDTSELDITLQPATLSIGSIEITGQPGEYRGSHLENASITVLGLELRKNLGSTLSETLSDQPGFAQRAMGAAPARPVLRGLGDSRVLILQDGERTGDMSHTTADHAVTIDPITANEIEIARGPAALAYGSNAIGGVINVVRDQIPTSRQSSPTGAASLMGSSVNNGLTGSGNIALPVHDDLMLNLDLNARYGEDYRTPDGKVDNTFNRSTNSAAALSYIRPWGYSGLAVSTYLSRYGIPPDPGGGHPDGVEIEMARLQAESRSEFVFEDRFFKSMESRVSYRYYNHKEFESADIIGTEYTAHTFNASVVGRHKGIGFLDDGTIGAWGEFQDYLVLDRGTLDANGFSGALFAIQGTRFGPWKIDFGLRFDFHHARPTPERNSLVIGEIRRRTFAALASSASVSYDLGRGWQTGASFLHSFRAPTMDELYSLGPHLAVYSFEIGNPELDAERGLASELFVSRRDSRSRLKASVYRNDFFNYIYPRNTGRPSYVNPNLIEYKFEGVEALMYGAEAVAEVKLAQNFSIDGMLSYTFGERRVDDDETEITGFEGSTAPLPMIPPLSGSIGVTWAPGKLTLGGRLRHSTAQDRLGEFETRTPAHTVAGVSAQYLFTRGDLLHTVSLRVDNLLNEEYHNHLSRIKELYPEPGRSFNLLYRVYF